MIGRRAALTLASAGLASPALAQRPLNLTLLIGAPAGSAGDRWGRGFAPFLERHWPRSSVAVANIVGEAGLVAARAIADAVPDGKAIVAVTTPLLLARAIETGSTGLLDRLDFVGAVADETLVLVVRPGTVNDFAGLRAVGANGRLGCPPQGSAAQLAASNAGRIVALEVIAFPSPGAARQAVIAGNLTAAMLPLPDTIAALREGKVQAVAIAGTRRNGLVPDVPLFGDIGLSGAAITQRGFALPRGVPTLMRRGMEEALEAVVADPEFIEQCAATGRIPRQPAPLPWDSEVRALMANLQQRWHSEPWVRRT